ncbi:HERV-H LTR-associating protein 1 [Boleophthalmus pectinirostris]|uniref:HERV-H LTR-associating protein 1 n=1 Tax=Boleophthalmus pectinirostris TaxID=150288 RepID=UPI00242C9CDB|nr:HERV-H LTR-associating protein 1 [Boleophthalmus pectinirostris]
MSSSQGRAPLFLLLSVSAVLLLLLCYDSPEQRSVEVRRRRRDDPEYTEFPTEHLDPAAIDLTPLVNTLINSSQSGSSQLFSLLSVTSYSSMALHKLTLLVYNISSIKTIESNKFRRRFCYCVNNETNDLTDFTAILLDVMGNSSSYLHELFKSSSILSVSQRNNSDCIYICVMAGQLGEEPMELWALDSITPLFNQTIVEGPHTVRNLSASRPPVPVGDWSSGSLNRSLMSPPVSRVHSTVHGQYNTLLLTGTTSHSPLHIVHSTVHVSPSSQAQESEDHPATSAEIQPATRPPLPPAATTSAKHPGTPAHRQLSTTPSKPVPPPTHESTKLPTQTKNSTSQSSVAPVQVIWTTQSSISTTPSHMTTDLRTTTDRRGTTTPTRLITTEQPGCPWKRPELEASTVKISAHKLQPCVFELCKFYSQCLCRSFRAKGPKKRYCSDSHLWYQKHTVEVCRRVRRLSFSRNLKQRCLSKMCDKL